MMQTLLVIGMALGAVLMLAVCIMWFAYYGERTRERWTNDRFTDIGEGKDGTR